MSTAIARALNAAIGRVLPERQIFIRTEANSRYLLLTPMAQASSILAIAVGLAWGGFATVKTFETTMEAERTALTRAAVERAWAARLDAIDAERAGLEREIAALRADRQAAARALGEAQGRLVEATAALRAADVERRALKRAVERIQLERSDAAERVAQLEATLRETRLSMLKQATDPQPEAVPEDLLSGSMITSAMGTVIAERDEALAEIASLDTQIADLTGQIEHWRDHQDSVLTKLETAARTSLEGLTTVLERADLDIERILATTRSEYSGSGGPFEPLTEDEAARLDGGEEDTRIAALMGDLERANLLRIAVDRLPFGLPVHGARFTSGFGKRRDPFRRRWSMHKGVDYAAPVGTPINTTAAGLVSFAGRMRGYGNIVIIKHAFGYETRYAHLKRALVKAGDRVTRGDRIALMGSTGRSSGSHLHYEIRIDEDPINPKKFIEATRDVL
ncbi:DUF5930 domain-containing protein [Paralimibaculum aggregatum]|uniref:DUF5930 domain-containing protein n=1 Tax=Paralimibaculum aggregatum TaxID=3036245 RepID=A0ABQ6LMN7_9RHOB|nr:DUF5930 domain-containing protein [Limibaculum sp. NKW23]GMG84466.1 DUF5930 domain-containing protein [Limibaculum sp. NKW23]